MMIEAWARSMQCKYSLHSCCALAVLVLCTAQFQNWHIKTISSIFLLSMERHSPNLTTGCLRLLPNKVIG